MRMKRTLHVFFFLQHHKYTCLFKPSFFALSFVSYILYISYHFSSIECIYICSYEFSFCLTFSIPSFGLMNILSLDDVSEFGLCMCFVFFSKIDVKSYLFWLRSCVVSLCVYVCALIHDACATHLCAQVTKYVCVCVCLFVYVHFPRISLCGCMSVLMFVLMTCETITSTFSTFN